MSARQTEIHNYLLGLSKNRHPKLQQLLLNNGELKLVWREETDLFVFLARTITGQQLSTKAARSIWDRILNLSNQMRLTLSELFVSDNQTQVRECGLSFNKIKAICELNNKFKSGELSSDCFNNKPYEEISNIFKSLWGVGQWTADMCMIFHLKKEDIYPSSDAAVKRGAMILFGDEADIAESFKSYSPYRSYLSRHIWAGLDSNLLR